MLRLAIIPLGLLALLAGAMIWSNADQGPPADFSYVCPAENKTLDIDVMSWLQDIRVAYGLWEGLFTPDPVTLDPVLGSADRVLISDDKTAYTFHIRDNAKWSNGDDLRARDFVFGWRRMIEQPGEYTYLFDYIKGARAYGQAYLNWKGAVAAWGREVGQWRADGSGSPAPMKPAAPVFDVGVEALGTKTLRVTLEHPLAYFPALCAYIPFCPQYEPCMRRFAQKDETETYVASYDQGFTRPPNLVSNGPYRLADWSFKRRVRLIANDYYWNRVSVKSRIIDQIYAGDPLAAYRIYERGEAGWLTDVAGDIAAELRAKGRSDLKLFPAFGTFFYDFNCHRTLPDGRENPLADRRVRRALSMAIDKRPIVEDATRSGEIVARTYVPPGVFAGYRSPPGLPYDVAEARRLLAEAGFPGGANFPRLNILFSTEHPETGSAAQIVRRQWQQNLGIEVGLEGIEITVFGARLHNHEFAIGAADWYGDYDDLSTFTDLFKSSSENNNPDWKSAEYDDLLRRATIETNPSRRLELLSRAENLMLEDAPIVPLYYGVVRYLIHDNVHGIPLTPRQMLMMQAVEVNHRR